MNKILILTLLMLGCYTKQNTQENISKNEVDQMLNNWKLAIFNKDVRLLKSILSDDFIYSGSSSGKRTNKEQMIENTKNDKSKMLMPEYYDVDVRFFDDIAIVRAKETLRFISASNDTSSVKLSFTDVYQKVNGKVRTISTHSSPISNLLDKVHEQK